MFMQIANEYTTSYISQKWVRIKKILHATSPPFQDTNSSAWFVSMAITRWWLVFIDTLAFANVLAVSYSVCLNTGENL